MCRLSISQLDQYSTYHGEFVDSTDNEFAEYISRIWFPGASLVDVKPILQLYPANPAAGSPFDTGDANSFTPQYKRISALQGDWFFHAPRRLLLDQFSARQPTYNYCRSSIYTGNIGAHDSTAVITRTRFTGLGVVSYISFFRRCLPLCLSLEHRPTVVTCL